MTPIAACCGRIPELVFGQWQPHPPATSCRAGESCWACAGCLLAKTAQACASCRCMACVHHALAGHPVLTPQRRSDFAAAVDEPVPQGVD